MVRSASQAYTQEEPSQTALGFALPPDSSGSAVERLAQLQSSGQLEPLLQVEPRTGRLRHPKAQTLLDGLPSLASGAAAETFVEHGLVAGLPQHLAQALDTPRYPEGRAVFVHAPVSFADNPKRPAGTYAKDAPPRITHLGTLVGQTGDDFWVRIDGLAEPIRVPRHELLALNEPHGIPAAGGVFHGFQVDYHAPLMRAHICAAALSLGGRLEELDFLATQAQIELRQKALIQKLCAGIQMDFIGRGSGYMGNQVAGLICGGQGASLAQSAAAAALLAPFTHLLAFDIQWVLGKTLRLGLPHAFLVLTLRPSLKRYICDPAWGEPLTDVNVACFGPGWGQDRRIVRTEGHPMGLLRDHDIALPTYTP